MNDSIIQFDFHGTEVRTVTIDGEPWFVLADLARVLDIAAPGRLAARLDEGVRQTHTLPTSGGLQSMTIVSEAGMYEVVIRSDKPQAVDFRRWITSEVLPSIRKHGGYLTEQKIEEVPTDPDTIIQLAQTLKREQQAREAMESYAKSLEPKADAYTAFMDAGGTLSVGSVAKMLGLSQNKLFALLRNHEIFISKGHMRNTPYQKYMHHFTVSAYSYERKDGTAGASYTTRVQPSGVEFIRRKLSIATVRPTLEFGESA